MSKLTVIKVTLSSGKVVYLRKLKISDTETAAQMCAARSNGNSQVLQIMMQKALVQLLLVKIGDKPVTALDLEKLDDLLEISEYSQVLQVIEKFSGGSESGKEPTLELISESPSEALNSGV